MIFWRHRPSKVDRATSDVCVGIHTTGKHNHSRSVDRATAGYRLDKPATVIDAEVPDFTVNVVRGVIDFPACNSKHFVSTLKKILLALLPVNIIWVENSLAHILDNTTFGIDFPKQTTAIPLMTGRTTNLLDLDQNCIGIAVEID